MFNLPITQVPSLVFPSVNLSSSPTVARGSSVYHTPNLPNYNDTLTPVVDDFQQPGSSNIRIGRLSTTPAPQLTTNHHHEYHRIPGTEDEILEGWLNTPETPNLKRKTFQCMWPGCTEEIFKRKNEAFAHVLKHLGITKLYECVGW